VDPANQECQEPNIGADGLMINPVPKARLALAVVISVANRAKRATLSRMTKFSVD
jgi:hypothetical protein